MTTRFTTSQDGYEGDGLPLDSSGRPEGPLAPARGVFLGVALGAALWAGAALLLNALF
jgi:hypothetical protein